jgi:hypothetical protein
MMNGFFDLAYSAKAWVGGVVFAVTQLVAGVQVAISDEAISFDEANGLYLLATEVVGAVLLVRQVFKARNAAAPKVGFDMTGSG